MIYWDILVIFMGFYIDFKGIYRETIGKLLGNLGIFPNFMGMCSNFFGDKWGLCWFYGGKVICFMGFDHDFM